MQYATGGTVKGHADRGNTSKNHQRKREKARKNKEKPPKNGRFFVPEVAKVVKVAKVGKVGKVEKVESCSKVAQKSKVVLKSCQSRHFYKVESRESWES